jgi:aminoglycoside phosphotransferase (APT) family kinase protein
MPNRMPAADVEVTTELVRRLLADQRPDLAGRPVEFLANGWDNAMFRLGDELLVRLPRRQVAARILLNEQRWLPALAPAIHLPIPAPERTGPPAHGYPFRWSVVLSFAIVFLAHSADNPQLRAVGRRTLDRVLPP